MKRAKNAYRSNNNNFPMPRSAPMSEADADLMSLEHHCRQTIIPEHALIYFGLDNQAFQLDARALNRLPEIVAISESLARFEVQPRDISLQSLEPGLDKGKFTRSAKSSVKLKLRCPVNAAREAIALLEARKDISISGFAHDPAPLSAARAALTRRCLAEFRDEAEARAKILGLAVLGFHRLSCALSEDSGGLVAADESGYFSASKARSAVDAGWRASLTLVARARGEVILGRYGPAETPAEA